MNFYTIISLNQQGPIMQHTNKLVGFVWYNAVKTETAITTIQYSTCFTELVNLFLLNCSKHNLKL